MKRLPAAFSSVTLLVQPVVTTIAGWALLGERLGLRQLLGGLVVMAGIVLAQRSGVREESG
jgi:drug/metabolite transporter (DMT)-like permease